MQEFISLSFFSYFITYSLRDFFHENIKFFISNIMNTFFFLMENRTLINRIILDIDFFFLEKMAFISIIKFLTMNKESLKRVI